MLVMYHDTHITGDDSKLDAWKKLTGSPVGYTVARAARILGMSRQAVAEAIKNDRLHATRIYMQTPKGKTLVSTEVDRDSVHEYAAARAGKDRVEYRWKTTGQKSLPI